MLLAIASLFFICQSIQYTSKEVNKIHLEISTISEFKVVINFSTFVGKPASSSQMPKSDINKNSVLSFCNIQYSIFQENISALPLPLRNRPCLAIPCRLTGVLPNTGTIFTHHYILPQNKEQYNKTSFRGASRPASILTFSCCSFISWILKSLKHLKAFLQIPIKY